MAFEDWLRATTAVARAEAKAANAAGWQDASAGGDRSWLHVDDWIRMRPSVALIVGLIRSDGVVTETENEIISDWVVRWLDRSQWGGYYRDSKLRALAALANDLNVTPEECQLYAELCRDRLSKTKLAQLRETVRALQFEAVTHATPHHDLVISILDEA